LNQASIFAGLRPCTAPITITTFHGTSGGYSKLLFQSLITVTNSWCGKKGEFKQETVSLGMIPDIDVAARK
jgi:hypothetical protein